MANLIGYMGLRARLAWHKFFTDERGDVNVVAIVVLIAVAVILAVTLKNQLSGLIDTLVQGITTSAKTKLDLQ